ncbi:exocyst complex component sec5 domain-containing protein [Hirsutella rhossiliensis]|uniref:Exocyst complex component SEC5 n=1 Tax=Hirsutella rhossiliensis TaxID=111463 RepID=A0A9P8SL60_9HYPO|nr:exocyst complex component sec5 domain-containing protein [Hirsutella rhossiliensis]KAH0965480.1 exocyst complex component sec5 domain-containing protein [Hirsutella rhossiliensis]
MAEYDRTILEFYQLPTPFPAEWPAEKDANDSSGDDEKGAKHRRQSRYQALETAVNTRRSLLSGPDGGNLVQKDEPDPLGSSDSVVRSLSTMGLPLQDDVRMRNRFLLSSTTFSPALFLSQMHADADTRSLLQGLDVLSQSIDQKSASLKVLVETNFERFVRAKATIDNVYKEMNRNSFRQSGNGGLSNPLALSASDSRKKNALLKESEYGLLGIKVPLLDVSAKAEDVWGPALGGREKEENLKTVSNHLDQFKEYVQLSASVSESIKRKDYESLVEAYNRARKFADEARRLSRELGGHSPSDAQLYQMVLAGRVWNDVEQQVQSFKRDVWKKLMSLQTVSKLESLAGRTQDQHMDIISMLLELGAEENPIHVWLATRYEQLKGKVQAAADRSKVEIEVLRRRLASNDKPPPQVVASHLQSLGRQSVEGKHPSSDSADVIELWEKMLTFLTNLISSQGILGELVDFWQTVQGFIDGKTQRMLPLGYNGESRHHHQLSPQAVTDLEKGVVEMVELLREHVYAFFASPPPEDISLLFSPLPLSPNSPASANALTPTALRDPRFNFDPSNPPPPSPRRGEPWEKLAFWPPWSNSISGAHYLSRMLALVGSGASDMACIGPVATRDPQLLDHLKSLVGISRERCVTALCAAWNTDAENIKYVEDWQRAPGSKDVTRMPAAFSSFEGALLSGMQKILYILEAMEKTDAGNIVLPPPPKLLQMVRSQYVTTLYKALSGMVENAERSVMTGEDEWTAARDSWNRASSVALVAGKSAFDVGDRNVRMLLTLSNLQALRSQVVPNLNSQFENAFSVKLTDESKTIRDVLGQIDARLFQSYTKPSIDKLREIIQAGLCAPDWMPAPNQRPQTAKPYVYEALLALVLVHSQVSTTAPSLTAQVLSFLLEQTSLQILDAFRRRPRYSLEALMQATLDVEFVAQTLSHYTTDRASELQSQIYQELDARTDNDARARLQNELPEMRSVLKKLREASKNEFACFKKPKRHGHGGSKPDSGSVGS